MTKEEILDQIRRSASANGGVPLGQERFSRETAVRKGDWYPRFWLRWSDAIAEAGLAPNEFGKGYSEESLLLRLVELARELGRFPIEGDLRQKKSRDSTFPSHMAFARLGQKRERIAKVAAFCRTNEGYVLASCPVDGLEDLSLPAAKATPRFGFVYLLKGPGRTYKIGKTKEFGRRSRELSIQLPFQTRKIHVIETDDPDGVETYWHQRFSAKRINSEWFDLEGDDVAAFRRWKRLR